LLIELVQVAVHESTEDFCGRIIEDGDLVRQFLEECLGGASFCIPTRMAK
jgi:hypothetical protein